MTRKEIDIIFGDEYKVNITSFGLKNFRVFKNYVNFSLKPFTILTGPNNTGKSSVAKALLLINDNDDEINAQSCTSEYLNYFGGEHYLGNHNLVLNEKEENLVFYFSFFKNYQYTKEVAPNGEFVNDYAISLNDKLVIWQNGGVVKFHFKRLVSYFHQRVKAFHFEDKSKINYFIFELEKISDLYRTAEINLYEYEYCRIKIDDNIEIDEKRLSKVLEKHKELLAKNIYTFYAGDSLDVDLMDIIWHVVLAFIFKKITDVQLTQDEVVRLIPFPEGAYKEDSHQVRLISTHNISYIPTIKEQIKRGYSIFDKSVIASIIRLQTHNFNVDAKSEIYIKGFNNKESHFWHNINGFAQKWLKIFEIGEKLTYGYNAESDSFFIKIDDKYIPEYGFGYSQIIYLIFTITSFSHRLKKDAIFTFPKTIIIEEPETGLHPAFQSKIAEMLLDAYKEFEINFIIETHSEYFIRKIQLLTAQEQISTKDSIIYYFNNINKIHKGERHIKKLNIRSDGMMDDDFGEGFFDESARLTMDLLKMQSQN